MMKRCPGCGSTELMSMGRKHDLGELKHPMAWVFFFPMVPLLLLQVPVEMKCDDCGKSYIQRGGWPWVWRTLLVLTLGFWAWVMVSLVWDAVR